MEQTFRYPNLLSGTRDHMSLCGYNNFVRPVALAAAPGGLAYALVNADAKENYLWTSLADLRHGKEYALSLWMASTDNCASTDVFAIDTEDGHYDAIGVVLEVKPPSGGGVVLLDILGARPLPRGKALLRAHRQQREHGRQGVDALRRRRHAHRGHGAEGVGTGGRGGVA